MNLKNKLHDARQRLNGLESVEDYQMDELKDLKKSVKYRYLYIRIY